MLLQSLKHSFLPVILCLVFPLAAFAQKTYEISGVVTDAKTGEPVIGAGVMLKASNIGVITDVDGSYTIHVNDDKGVLVCSALSYKPQEFFISGKRVIDFSLEPDVESLEDAVVVGYGTQKRATVTGALTTVDTKLLETSAAPSLSNAIGGVMPGVITRQSSGEPGYDGATILIRGLGTWVNAAPLVLVDGIERDINLINTDEIASFSILKDASATAVYGMKGANGVILINTKKGSVGLPKVSFRTEMTQLRGIRFPEYIEGYEFANLMNEACMTAGNAIPWSDEDLEKFRDGSDPYNYPNVNWTDEVLKKTAFQTLNTLSVSGGNETIRYYVSLGFTSQSGIFKEDPNYSYRTNSLAQRYNFRSNVDVNLTKSFSISLGLSEIIQDRTYPGTPAATIFNSLKVVSPIAYCMINPDGTFGGGNSSYEWLSPYVYATNSGFAKQFRTTTQGTVGAKWDLSSLVTEGLALEGHFAYDHYYMNEDTRPKTPLVKKFLGYAADGSEKYNTIKDESAMGYYIASSISNRAIYFDARATYDRTFGKHTIGALAMFSCRDYQDHTAGTSYLNLPYRRMGVSARLNYNYDERYLLELDLGYNGSENFAKGHRFGLFPAVSAGWILSNEDFFSANWVDHIKIRASYGMVGNDANGASRFFYMSSVNKNASSFPFGSGQTVMNGMAESQSGSVNATWEKSRKADAGFDMEFFNRLLRISADYFHEYRTDILLQPASIPDVMGLSSSSKPWANIGVMQNQGFDGQVEVSQTTANGLFYSVRANMTYARNKIIEDGTPEQLYAYQNTRGVSAGRALGYVALGLFQSEDEIYNSPAQELGSYGVGDIKYDDLNGDNVINAYDRKWIGYAREPEIMFGLGFTLAYKGFDMSLNFTGAGHTSIFIDEASMWPFELDYPGYNILREYYNNRFIPGEDNTGAKYPVVHQGNSSNNFTINTLYQRDGSYLKLKTAEIGYNFPKRFCSSIKMETLRLFINGNNLFCIDKVKIVDPESNHLGASTYPTQMGLSAGLQIGF